MRDFEPHVALFGGATGFELYDRIVADAPRVLRPGGWLVMELGFGCADHVAALLSQWDSVSVEPDLAGIPRVIAARVPALPSSELQFRGESRSVGPAARDEHVEAFEPEARLQALSDRLLRERRALPPPVRPRLDGPITAGAK